MGAPSMKKMSASRWTYVLAGRWISIVLSGAVGWWAVFPLSTATGVPYMWIESRRLLLVIGQSMKVPLKIASFMSLLDG